LRISGSKRHYLRYSARASIHTNTLEGYFSIFKRGMNYQHCSETQLHRYLAEFRYSQRIELWRWRWGTCGKGHVGHSGQAPRV
jgi:ISXO2-like transposase domain